MLLIKMEAAESRVPSGYVDVMTSKVLR